MHIPYRSLRKLTPVVLGIGLLWAGPSFADVHVSPSGTDSGSCDSQNPCATVTYALTKMSDGDTMLLRPGTYSHTVTKATWCGIHGVKTANIAISASNNAPQCANLGCTIRAQTIADPPNVIVSGAQYPLFIRERDNWTIRGIHFEGQSAGMVCESNNVTIEDSVFLQNADGSYSELRGLSFCGHAQPVGPCTRGILPRENRTSGYVVRRVKVRPKNIVCDVEYLDNGLGKEFSPLNFQNVKDVTIEDGDFGFGTDGVTLAYAENVVFRRNRIVHWSGHGIMLFSGSKNLLFENNIIGGAHECAAECAGDNYLNLPPPAGNKGVQDNNCTQAPMGFDVYEVDDITIRNNSFVGHGYMPSNAWGGIYQGTSGITTLDCGRCSGDGSIACDSNDECVGNGVCVMQGAYQNCYCTDVVCDRQNIRFYNNLVSDLSRPNGTADSYFISHRGCGGGCTTSNAYHDGNLYDGDPGKWRVGNPVQPPYTALSFEDWQNIRQTNSLAASYLAVDPDEHGVTAVPAFADYGSGNYRPAGPSASQVNSGLSGVDANGIAFCAAQDFEGNTRTDGSCDIGAFEYQGETTTGSDLPPPDGVHRTDTTTAAP